jgi:hypothetical protein
VGQPFRNIRQPDKGTICRPDAEGKTDPDLFLSHHVRSGEPAGESVVKPATRREIIVIN